MYFSRKIGHLDASIRRSNIDLLRRTKFIYAASHVIGCLHTGIDGWLITERLIEKRNGAATKPQRAKCGTQVEHYYLTTPLICARCV